MSVLLDHWQALVLVLAAAVGGVWHWLQTKHARAEGLAEGKALQAKEALDSARVDQAAAAEASRKQAEEEQAAAARRAAEAVQPGRIETAEEMVRSIDRLAERGRRGE